MRAVAIAVVVTSACIFCGGRTVMHEHRRDLDVHGEVFNIDGAG